MELEKGSRPRWYRVGSRAPPAPLMSTLAYRRSVALKAPFADTSLAEDLHFAEAAVIRCLPHRTLTLPSVYTRHGANTWNWTSTARLHRQLAWQRSLPPSFVDDTDLEPALSGGLADMQRRASCAAPRRWRPEGFHVQHFPNLPASCCHLERLAGCNARALPGGAERTLRDAQFTPTSLGYLAAALPPQEPPAIVPPAQTQMPTITYSAQRAAFPPWNLRRGLQEPTASFNASARSTAPLATVVVLTCNRPQYALLAVRQIVAQDYRPLEALVVDDGSGELEPLLRKDYPGLVLIEPQAPDRPPAPPPATNTSSLALTVRLVTLDRHASIGEKRAIAARLAAGSAIVHWDDDDFHEPHRISAQVGCPAPRSH